MGSVMGSHTRTFPAQRKRAAGREGAATRAPLNTVGKQEGEARTPPLLTQNKQSKRLMRELLRGTNNLEQSYQRPARQPHKERAEKTGEGRRGEHRPGASTETHNGHAAHKRRATRPSSQKVQTTWNGVPEGEGKGDPKGATRHKHSEGCQGGTASGGGRESALARPSRPALSAVENTNRALHPPRQ